MVGVLTGDVILQEQIEEGYSLYFLPSSAESCSEVQSQIVACDQRNYAFALEMHRDKV